MRARLGEWVMRYRGGLLAAAIIALGAGLRVALVAAGWPGTDSDDSTMGLMALHILTRGEHPIFFYGQAYMGTIEAYLGALMFALFGVSLFALKLGLIALYAAFMALMYLLLAGLFSRRWALAGLLLLALGSDTQLYQQLNAYGGYLETLFFGALTLLLAYGLARGEAPFATRRTRLAGYGAWGLAAGLGIWSDPLVSPFVVVSALLIAAFAPREARGRAGLLAALGLLVGLSPWLIYIVAARNPTAATSFLQHVPQATVTPTPKGNPPSVSAAPWQVAGLHAAGVVVIAVPDETGASGLCPLASAGSWPPSQWGRASLGCLVARGLWGGGYLALLALAIILQARAFIRLWRASRGVWLGDQRMEAARVAGRLAALLAPVATLLLFAISSSSASFPNIFDRYVISLLIATPVIVASLWQRDLAARDLAATKPAFAGWGASWGVRMVAVAALYIGLVAALASGMVGTWRQTPAQPAAFRLQHDLINQLVARGDTRVYSEFWTCYRLIFLSDERVVCSVLNGDLSQRPSRWAPYDALVAATPDPAYVFPLRSSQAVSLLRVASQRGWHVQVIVVDDIYGIFRVTPGAGAYSRGDRPAGQVADLRRHSASSLA